MEALFFECFRKKFQREEAAYERNQSAGQNGRCKTVESLTDHLYQTASQNDGYG